MDNPGRLTPGDVIKIPAVDLEPGKELLRAKGYDAAEYFGGLAYLSPWGTVSFTIQNELGEPVFPEGATFGFDKAHELGLVNEVYEAEDRDDFLKKVMEYAAQFTTPNKATKAVGLIKRSVQTGAELPFELALALERELQAQLFASGDAKEGLTAYVEKRKPDFKGS